MAYMTCGILADYVFEPMFGNGGLLSSSVGRLIGTGKGRGIGFMLILSGIGMMVASFAIRKNKAIKEIQVNREVPNV